MRLSKIVPIFGLLCRKSAILLSRPAIAVLLAWATLQARADTTTTGDSAAPPVSMVLRLAGEAVENQDIAPPFAAIAFSADYRFYQNYSFGVQYSYEYPFTEFDDFIYNGMNDLVVYLAANEFWKDTYDNMSLTAKIAGIEPTSPASKQASLEGGVNETLTFKKGFGDKFAIYYILASDQYDYLYTTVLDPPNCTQGTDGCTQYYNIRFDVANKLNLVYNLYPDTHLMLGGAIQTFNDFANDTYNIYFISAGLSYDLSKHVSFDFSVKTAIKDPGSDDLWNAPATADTFFDPSGTLFYLGMSVSF